MTDDTVTLLTEDILDATGFRVDWHYTTHSCEFNAYRIYKSELQPGTPLFQRAGASNSDFVLNTQEAEVYMTGALQAAGKVDLDHGRVYLSGEQAVIKHCMLISYLWQKAHQLMEASECRA